MLAAWKYKAFCFLQKLVREFPDCRDLVEDAFFFHISPEMVVAEEPRESYKPGEYFVYYSDIY